MNTPENDPKNNAQNNQPKIVMASGQTPEIRASQPQLEPPPPGRPAGRDNRIKWQYGRSYVSRLISAAEVYRPLLTNCQQRKPEHESQIRPLVGLTADQARQVWEHVTGKAGEPGTSAR